MFEDIGKKIKGLARFLCWVGIGISVIIAIALIPLLVRQKSSKVQGIIVVLSYAVYLFFTIA